jgi:sulfopyruvate decarboxylase subunit beta
MKRIQAIAMASQAAEVREALLISNIGYPSRELYAVKDRRENFYMLGSMGLASSIGLGLALAQPGRKVIVLEGDGSVLMNLGTLATIAHHAQDNYLLVILDNCCYGSTGSQPTCTSEKTDLAGLAQAAGVEKVKKASSLEELEEALDIGLEEGGVLVVRVDPGNAQVPVIDLSPSEILQRFMGSFLPALPP